MRIGFLLLLLVATIVAEPKHIHIALTNKPDSLSITWYTSQAKESLVKYIEDGFGDIEEGKIVGGQGYALFFDHENEEGFKNDVILNDLKPGTTYKYQVGSSDDWSKTFYFKTQSIVDPTVRFFAYGDMGVRYANSSRVFELIAPEAGNLQADLVIHAGDMAYAFSNFTFHDVWFERAEKVAAYIPYMIAPGNRDERPIIKERWNMPKAGGQKVDNFYSSFDYGCVHFIEISTNPDDNLSYPYPQYKWFENDLKAANQRDDISWIVLYGHTPMYSSSDGHTGGNKLLKDNIEHLLYKYNVDVAIWGDDHVYERSYPIYDDVIDSTHYRESGIQVFTSPGRTIHLLAGTGGIDLDGFREEVAPEWSAFRERVQGYLDITATPKEFRGKFVRIDSTVADRFVIERSEKSMGNFEENSMEESEDDSEEEEVGGISVLWLLFPMFAVGMLYFVRSKPKRFIE